MITEAFNASLRIASLPNIMQSEPQLPDELRPDELRPDELRPDEPHRYHVELTHQPLPLQPLQSWIDLISDADNGAMAWFYGVTRRTTGHQITHSLYYEAHETMATKLLRELAIQTLQKFDLSGLVIVHRLGDVPVGSASIVVGCGSPHRAASFDAQRYIMDQIKADIPIWKREIDPGGAAKWVHP